MSPREKASAAGGARSGKSREGSREEAHKDHQKPISILEWIVAGIGLLLVVAVVVFLVGESTRAHDGSPLISVRMDSVMVLDDGGYLVHFTAENRARTTAAAVSIVGELGEGPDAETRRATLDFVPGRAARRGGLVFARDPRGAGFKLRVEGFQEP